MRYARLCSLEMVRRRRSLGLNRCGTGWVLGESGAESERVGFEDGKWRQTGAKPVQSEAKVVRNRMSLTEERFGSGTSGL